MHDDAALATPIVNNFRRDLIINEIKTQSESIDSLTKTCDQLKDQLLLDIGSTLKYDALVMLLDRIAKGRENTLRLKHSNKLTKMYGGNMFLKEQTESVVNLSKINIDEELMEIFGYGMNCHIKSKYSILRKKIEIEKLQHQIDNEIAKKTISIPNPEQFKCELKRYGLRNQPDYNKDILSKHQHSLIKNLRENTDIHIRKADKSNTFVILNKEDYEKKLNEVVSDEQKFQKQKSDPTEDLKRKMNKLIDRCNAETDRQLIPKLVGHFTPGYIYGNPKIHKTKTNPPLRPIISQIGTPTYGIAKMLNSTLKPYVNRKYIIQSTDEFINVLRTQVNKGTLASLDVENLFTNIPVQQTIEIILETAYNHPNLKPPTIPKHVLEEMLIVCTTHTPFKHIDGSIYRQIDGLSMGSPLGPLFADYYMSKLENSILSQVPPQHTPLTYCRYVDDIFLIVPSCQTLDYLKTQFEKESILHFTYEIEKNKQLTFLDVNVKQDSNNKFKSSVHTKTTSAGDCINYRGLAPEQYKTGVIKTMVNRAYTICSTWPSLHSELDRLRQFFTNNNFPLALVEKEINKCLNKLYNPPTVPETTTNINLYYRNQMHNQYKQEEQNLRKIVQDHITPHNEAKINLRIYYKNRKLSHLLIKNNCNKSDVKSRAVYRYDCDKPECQQRQFYIGYTCTSLKQRMTTHAQNGSILNHNQTEHNIKIKAAAILDQITILHSSQDKLELQIAEALFIKELNPPLNSQREGEVRILHVF